MKLIQNAFAFLPTLLLMAFGHSSFVEKINIFSFNDPIILLSDNKTPAEDTDEFLRWNLKSSGLSYDAFEQALKGYHYFLHSKMLQKSNLLTIIDYSKPSSQKRLYVLDMNSGNILFNTWVAHGRNSGYNYATEFSNDEESHKTSLGFYITQNTYTGINGYSLKLKGCEKGINDKATERAIVFHGAEYVSESFIREHGYLGRSYGCPAIPLMISKKIIDKIKNGTCMFLYHPTKKYIVRSKILNS